MTSQLLSSSFSCAGIRPQSRWSSVSLSGTSFFGNIPNRCITAVLEYSLGLDLPEEVHNDPIIAELSLAGNDILTWANDVYSFPVSGSLNRTVHPLKLTCLIRLDRTSTRRYAEPSLHHHVGQAARSRGRDGFR
jgi:hypothetical protein